MIEKTFCTFITPTIGRDSLRRTAKSLAAQTDDDWNWEVIGTPQGVMLPHSVYGRTRTITTDMTRTAGERRNMAMEYTHDPEWYAFVDDDDSVTPDYVQRLRQESEATDADIIVFRMVYPCGTLILPDPENPSIEWGKVGISYAIRPYVADNVKFVAEDLSNQGPEGNEDINFLLTAQQRGFDIHIAPHITYRVRH